RRLKIHARRFVVQRGPRHAFFFTGGSVTSAAMLRKQQSAGFSLTALRRSSDDRRSFLSGRGRTRRCEQRDGEQGSTKPWHLYGVVPKAQSQASCWHWA